MLCGAALLLPFLFATPALDGLSTYYPAVGAVLMRLNSTPFNALACTLLVEDPVRVLAHIIESRVIVTKKEGGSKCYRLHLRLLGLLGTNCYDLMRLVLLQQLLLIISHLLVR